MNDPERNYAHLHESNSFVSSGTAAEVTEVTGASNTESLSPLDEGQKESGAVTTQFVGSALDNLIRKVDLHILVLVNILYICSYLDRANLGNAKSFLITDLHLSELEYSWCSSIFFVTYTMFEVPSNVIMENVGARLWIARIALTWGAISTCMMFVTNFAGLIATRLALGLAEAGFFPGVLLYLTYWYTKAERGRKIAIFYMAQAMSGVIGGILSYAVLHMDGVGGLKGWQWLFLIEGTPAMLMGVVVLFALPDRPSVAGWLTQPERDFLTNRLHVKYQASANNGHGSSGPPAPTNILDAHFEAQSQSSSELTNQVDAMEGALAINEKQVASSDVPGNGSGRGGGSSGSDSGAGKLNKRKSRDASSPNRQGKHGGSDSEPMALSTTAGSQLPSGSSLVIGVPDSSVPSSTTSGTSSPTASKYYQGSESNLVQFSDVNHSTYNSASHGGEHRQGRPARDDDEDDEDDAGDKISRRSRHKRSITHRMSTVLSRVATSLTSPTSFWTRFKAHIPPKRVLKETFANRLVWAFSLANFFTMVPISAITFFLPSVIAQFGYGKITSNLISAAPYLVACVAMYWNSRKSDVRGESSRFRHIFFPALGAVVSFVLMGAVGLKKTSDANIAVAAGQMLVACMSTSNMWMSKPVLFAWMSNTMKGSLAMSIALVIAIGNLGAIIGPLVMGASESYTDSYSTGVLVIAMSELAFSACVLWIRFEVNRLPAEPVDPSSGHESSGHDDAGEHNTERPADPVAFHQSTSSLVPTSSYSLKRDPGVRFDVEGQTQRTYSVYNPTTSSPLPRLHIDADEQQGMT